MPLLSGGGSPVKFIEALAHGLPVVATPRAAAGRGRREPAPLPRGRRREGFARSLLEALDPAAAAEVGAAGRTLAESDYSIEALARRLAE